MPTSRASGSGDLASTVTSAPRTRAAAAISSPSQPAPTITARATGARCRRNASASAAVRYPQHPGRIGPDTGSVFARAPVAMSSRS